VWLVVVDDVMCDDNPKPVILVFLVIPGSWSNRETKPTPSPEQVARPVSDLVKPVLVVLAWNLRCVGIDAKRRFSWFACFALGTTLVALISPPSGPQPGLSCLALVVVAWWLVA